MRDREYLNAFAERLLRSYKNIDATISDSTNSIKLNKQDKTTIHLFENTPIMIDESDLDKFSAQIIVLDNKELEDCDGMEGNGSRNWNKFCRSGENGITYLFKYQPFTEIIKHISKKYYELTGDSISYGGIADIICICGDAENIHYSLMTRAIAGQHKYKLGGELLHLSTRSINYTNCLDATSEGSGMNLSRIIYYLDIDKPLEFESYATCDEYGIYHLCLPYDINALSTLDKNAFAILIEHLRTCCDVIFAEIGSEFNANGLMLLNEAKQIWWFSDKCSERIAKHSIKDYEGKRIYYIDSHSEDIDIKIDEIIENQAREASCD